MDLYKRLLAHVWPYRWALALGILAMIVGGLADAALVKLTGPLVNELFVNRNKDLAVIARLSEFHFNVAFRNSVGHPPHEYIIRRRMERAQGLMLSTNKSLIEIAADCGLSDQAHLTRLFRRVVGESPAAWRRARANPGG